MALKLRQMKLDLRDQFEKGGMRHTNEDMQSYDSYKSPISKQKLDFNQKIIPAQKEVKPSIAAVNVVLPNNNPTASTNFDKIKGSKLFQKFMQKEQQAAT